MHQCALPSSSIKLRKPLLRKTYSSCDLRVDRPVFSGVRIFARAVLCSFLTNNNATGIYLFSAKELQTQALASAITIVRGGSPSFLMRHESYGKEVFVCWQ